MGIKISKEEIKLDSQDLDYDHKAVRRFIREGRLAPLYKGLSEAVPSQTATVVECPICFLCYPNAINYSRCCNQPICTNCFLKLKRSPKHPLLSASCPFCCRPQYGIIYIPSPLSHEYQVLSRRRKSLVDRRLDNPRRSLGFNDPDVVLVDEVRPDWHKMVERKQGAMPRGMSGSGTTRRTVVRPNGATPIVNRVRASGSAYYANTTMMDRAIEWQNDEEVTVINAIRESAAEGAAALVQAAA